MEPSLHRGHLPCPIAVNRLLCIFLAGSVPKVSQDTDKKIRGDKQIQDPEVDASGYAYMATTDVILQSSFAHGTLCRCRNCAHHHDQKDRHDLHSYW